MPADNKTEKPTPKRRHEARKKGQVARSMELGAAAVLLAGTAALALTGPDLLGRLEAMLTGGLMRSSSPDLVTREGIGSLGKWSLLALAAAIAPVLVATGLAGLLANVAQVGLKLTPEAVKPSLRKIDPMQGFKRLLGPAGLFEGAKAIAKTAAVGTVAFLAAWPEIPRLAALVGLPPAELVAKLAGTVLSLALRVGLAFALIAVVDYLWMRRRHERSLRMSKDEVRQESRQTDIAPEVRGAIRRRQREQARRRMLADVPTADVVVTNPTHFAVALRYDGRVTAPEVVAKGADHLAAAIRRVADEHRIPLVHNPPLARSLYYEVDLGQMIPEAFYAAVAEVLAFVFRTAGRRSRPARGPVARRRLNSGAAQTITGP